MNKLDTLMIQLEGIKQAIAAELEKQNLFGSDEDYEKDTVLFWKRNFGGASTYTYIALKLRDNAWWVSNKHNSGSGWISFERLVDHHLRNAVDEGVDKIWRATEWEAVAEVAE